MRKDIDVTGKRREDLAFNLRISRSARASCMMIEPSERAIASNPSTGVASSAVTEPQSAYGGRIVYISFLRYVSYMWLCAILSKSQSTYPVLRFQMSTPPSCLPRKILFRKVGRWEMTPESAGPEVLFDSLVGVIVV